LYSGNISYPAHLLHFSIQLALLIFTRLVQESRLIQMPAGAAYAAPVITLGVLSLRFFEKPAKEWVLASKSATR
jgi:peptidoglycan/LPS O-acetylase OafA/YrhL